MSDDPLNLRISELPKLSAMSPDDYIVIQRSKHSYKVSLATLSAKFKTAFTTVGVKSAVSCSSALFAQFAHGHDYSDMWFFPSYGPESKNTQLSNRQLDNCDECGEFRITRYFPDKNQSQTSTLSVFQPKARERIDNELSDFVQYRPGDLQLIATNNFQNYLTAYRGYTLDAAGNISLNDDKFDGFVIPNGRTYSCAANNFKAACKLYSSTHSETATSFTVPNLNGMFFKCDPGLASMTPMQVVPYSNALMPHSHGTKIVSTSTPIDIELNNIEFKLRASDASLSTTGNFDNCVVGGRATYSYTGQQSIHYTPNDPAPYFGTINKYINSEYTLKIYKFSADANIRSIICNANEDDDRESFPTYQKIQALLYIGKA